MRGKADLVDACLSGALGGFGGKAAAEEALKLSRRLRRAGKKRIGSRSFESGMQALMKWSRHG